MFLEQKLTQKQIHEENTNLLKYFFDSENRETKDYEIILSYVQDNYKDDKDSLTDYLGILEDIEKKASLTERGTVYRPGLGEHGANTQDTVLAEAILSFSSTVMSQIIQGDKVVSPYMQGRDEQRKAIEDEENEQLQEIEEADGYSIKDDSKHQRAVRAIKYINYLLLKKNNKWATDLDKLGFCLAAFGNAYKKISYNEGLGKVENNLILPNKLIFNYATSDFEECIKTEEQEIFNRDYIGYVMSDYFIDFKQKQSIENQEKIKLCDKKDILEQHTYLDLDQDGYYEPYIVYFSDNKLLRITPRYTEKDIVKSKDDKNILRIDAQKIYIPFYFLPSIKNTVFSQSFGTLLHHHIEVLNACKNQLLDAGKFSNAAATTALIGTDPISRGGRNLQSSSFKFKLGEIKEIPMSGQDLARNIVPMPFREPSQTLYNLMQDTKLEAKSLVSLRDVLTGDIGNNVAGVTALARIDQGLKQYKSIYKRIHQSLKEEFKLIYDIIYNNFENHKKEYLEFHDLKEEGGYKAKNDFDNTGFDITPIATADIVMSSQKIAEIGLLKELAASPEVDQRKVVEKICNLHGFDVDDLLIEEKNELDPITELEMQSKAIDNEQKKANLDKTAFEIEKIKSDITKNHFEAQIKNTTEAIKVKDDELKRESDKEKNIIANKKVNFDIAKFNFEKQNSQSEQNNKN